MCNGNCHDCPDADLCIMQNLPSVNPCSTCPNRERCETDPLEALGCDWTTQTIRSRFLQPTTLFVPEAA